jgi:hypothetical protein
MQIVTLTHAPTPYPTPVFEKTASAAGVGVRMAQGGSRSAFACQRERS